MSCRSRLSVLNEKLTYLETKVDHIETRGTNGDEEQNNQLHNCTDMSQGNELLLNDFSLWWVNTCFNIICDLKFAFKIAIKYLMEKYLLDPPSCFCPILSYKLGTFLGQNQEIN